jgi:predicted glycogen debranching enzyme
MDKLYSHEPETPLSDDDRAFLIQTEWLVTNGLSGYCTGTASGIQTRCFHGYLISALPSPFGRTMMLNDIIEEVVLSNGQTVRLNGEQTAEETCLKGAPYLTAFGLRYGLPVWVYELDGITIEKRILMPHQQNTIYLNYRVTAGNGRVHLRLRPAVNMRPHEAPVNSPLTPYTVAVRDQYYEILSDKQYPPLRISLLAKDAGLTLDSCTIHKRLYAIEQARGYIHEGELWSPGYFSATLEAAKDVDLVVSTENLAVMSALTPHQAWDAELDRRRRLVLIAEKGADSPFGRDLIWAADQFIFKPMGRQKDITRARAAGDEICSIIAGYHWFTDWGRDTMISLEGLTLTTGRRYEASYILRTFAHYIKDGLIPNMFPEGQNEGLYHTADATLWFFHAIHRYMQVADDRHLMGQLLPKLVDIVGHHLRGTHYNIHVDHADGLLHQGLQGYQLTWMDAKVDDWVVTPRRGKAVEINALWYNALRILEHWLREAERVKEADGIAEHAARAKRSFNQRFWYAEGNYLYDVIDGENGQPDASLRPNQLFSFSLEYPVLNRERWEPVLQIAKEKLLTPVGLRSLAPGSPDYKPRYDGDLRSRDAAYHQGTVWAWLIGPFIDAWLKVYPDDLETAHGFLKGFEVPGHSSSCAGSINEIFDAEPPFDPRGCAAQAWSIAEVLRTFVKTNSSTGGEPTERDLAEVAAGS